MNFRIQRIPTLVLSTLAAMTATAAAAGTTTFSEVWSGVQQGRYATLPEYQTTQASFRDGNVNLLGLAANRTLSKDADLLPWFQKLVHPVGICLSGTWTITEASPYTGYFAQGAEGLIIMRASEALGSTRAGGYRALGLAGKIFPTKDPADQTPRPTASFFTVDDLGGTLDDSFLDSAKSNAPKTSFHLSQLAIFPMLTEIARTFSRADSDPGVRQLYPIAELGLASPAAARSPGFMSLVAESPERTGEADFRDELRVANYAQGLRFGIYTRDSGDWRRLGQIRLTRDVTSDGCDHRLHFQHPRTK